MGNLTLKIAVNLPETYYKRGQKLVGITVVCESDDAEALAMQIVKQNPAVPFAFAEYTERRHISL